MEILQTILHYGMHLAMPLGIAWFFFKDRWKKVYLIFLAAMLIDLDHLLASPVFDPTRCSIGFHPLHSYVAIGVYVLLTFIPKTRIIGLALVWHMITDVVDCFWH